MFISYINSLLVIIAISNLLNLYFLSQVFPLNVQEFCRSAYEDGGHFFERCHTFRWRFWNSKKPPDARKLEKYILQQPEASGDTPVQ